jgi:hypothetical protein
MANKDRREWHEDPTMNKVENVRLSRFIAYTTVLIISI